jgi:Histone deacetylase domain
VDRRTHARHRGAAARGGIRDALRARDATFVDAESHPDEDVLAVHDARLLDYLRHAWDDWDAAGLPSDPGQDRVVPYVFAHPGLTPHFAPAVPQATWARPGYFAYDTMTLVGPGTWEAARAAVDAALTAADLVADGAPAAYAATRPPGHAVPERNAAIVGVGTRATTGAGRRCTRRLLPSARTRGSAARRPPASATAMAARSARSVPDGGLSRTRRAGSGAGARRGRARRSRGHATG